MLPRRPGPAERLGVSNMLRFILLVDRSRPVVPPRLSQRPGQTIPFEGDFTGWRVTPKGGTGETGRRTAPRSPAFGLRRLHAPEVESALDRADPVDADLAESRRAVEDLRQRLRADGPNSP